MKAFMLYFPYQKIQSDENANENALENTIEGAVT